MKKRAQRSLDVVHHGLVLIGDGAAVSGRGRPARLLLTKDQLSVQLPCDASEEPSPLVPDDAAVRSVVVRRRKEGGLGLSIKGGTENSQNQPIIISKIFPKMPADETGQLHVGDAIVSINGMPVEGRSHDDVVEMLKAVPPDDDVTLGVRQCAQMAPYLRSTQSLQNAGRSSSVFDKTYEANTWKSALKAQSELGLVGGSSLFVLAAASNQGGGGLDSKSDRWKTVTSVSLPMAYVTRYLWGTDTLRANSFEVRAVDGTSTGVVHCEDAAALAEWLVHIHNHIQALNHKSVKMSNKHLHQSEQITFIGWVSEYQPEEEEAGGMTIQLRSRRTPSALSSLSEAAARWQPRFLIIKGPDVCVFESPPLNSEDLSKCLYLYKAYDAAVRQVPLDGRRLDRRDCVIWLETAGGPKARHFLAFDAAAYAESFEHAFYKCVYASVSATQTRTFACSFEGRPSGLVFDIRQGISLYDIPTKSYIWQYRFADIHASSDDGKITVRFVFNDARSIAPGKHEEKEIECDEVLSVVYTLHAFIIAKMVASDPGFLKANPLI